MFGGELKCYAKEFIMVNKEFMADTENYTHREQFVHTLLQGLRNDLTETATISIDMIADLLGLSYHTKNRTAIKEVLISLEQKGLISVYEDIFGTKPVSATDIKVNGTYSIRLHEMQTDEDYFAKIELNYLRQFVLMKEKSKDISFAVYFKIISHLYNNDSSRRFSFPNIETIERDVGVNKKTVMKHINLLMENEIIYYETVRLGKHKDKNLYSKWHDMIHVSDAVRKIENGANLDDL